MEDDLTIQPIEPAPAPPDGTVEMHPDGGGATIYRTMTALEVAAMMARYNADRAEGWVEQPRYEITMLYGSTEMPKATGQWRQDPDGGWWEEHTPHRWLDQDGKVYREEPYTPYVRIMGGPNPGYLLASGGYPPSRPWWAFWRSP